jgi:uncharacterized membrane protein YozB (DUF420 family)
MMATRSPAMARWNAERLFYSGMALAMLATIFIGFAPSYYLRGVVEPYAPVLPMTPISHLHGILFSAWTALFVAQTWLVGAGRRDIHRVLGLTAFALLPAMIVVALLASLHGAVRHAGPPTIPPLNFLAVPLFDIPVFAILIGVALWKRREAQTHKRLMLLTMVGMMGPAIGRLPIVTTLPPPVVIFGLPDLFLLALVGWDLATRGRLHQATIWGGALLVGSQILRTAIMMTPAWVAAAGWMVGFVR